MDSTFFSRRVRLFGSVAMLILCVVFFFVPFAVRGARMAVSGMKNDVKDWLPGDFPETRELKWFYDHFLGEAFIVVTWPGCNEDDDTYKLFVEKLRTDTVPTAEQLAARGDLTKEEKEDLRARATGDRHGLFLLDEQYENWGGIGEKWLQGDKESWYFVTPDGELYRWDGKSNVLGWTTRTAEKILTKKNRATGELIATFGEKSTPGRPNRFHENPRMLTARLFKKITTGPEILDQLAGENGSLRPDGSGDDEATAAEARRLAHERLSGVLFGPQPPAGFAWDAEDFERVVPRQKLKELPEIWKPRFNHFVAELVEKKFGGDRQSLLSAPRAQQEHHWDELFVAAFGTEPPARQTCILVSLSEPGVRDMSRAIGRPVMGKPMGRILEIAHQECAISTEDLKMGGPPVDNVAIDEEGKITLMRLAVFSALVGLGLSFICFRSINITIMIFFVGGVSAVMSLGIVWWGGSSVDAIVMSMPSLVYVLGLSGAVHIVNYYREAVNENGVKGAPETAVRHGWFPCTLAAFTTALGLISLYLGSNVVPIQKFGLFAALGTMATVILLFTYLPSALHVWPSGSSRRREDASEPFFTKVVASFWDHIGGFVVRYHWAVAAGMIVVMIVGALGLPKVNTSVHLLKLFDKDAKIIRDYAWLEDNLCNLVPMELVVCVDKDMQRPPLDEIENSTGEYDANRANLQYDFLERTEMAARVQQVIEEEFGESGRQIVGRALSASSFIPPLPDEKSGTYRSGFNGTLERSRERLLAEEYLRIDKEDERELWRVSLRVGALNDVDYGEFVNELKVVVEPVMSAYRQRNRVLREIDRGRRYSVADAIVAWPSLAMPSFAPLPPLPLSPGADSEFLPLPTDSSAGYGTLGQRRLEGGVFGSNILVLGADPASFAASSEKPHGVDQTRIFVEQFESLLLNKGFRRPSHGNPNPKSAIVFHDPQKQPLSEVAATPEQLAAILKNFDAVVVVKDHADYDLDFIRRNSPLVVEATDHVFDPASDTGLSAADRRAQGDVDANITAAYTGIVPIVYKAQRTLLESLINSIGLAFVMIAIVMMFLLRDWRRRPSLRNSLNLPGGIASMLPNVFPVVVIFGAMGHLGMLVDIGSMMTASVAMGVAVDDTIHFLTWFRKGLHQGMDRKQAIKKAYGRCAMAMTQTTLIGGFGLAVFAFSTFSPTQQFGIMMLVLLAAALVGDLIFLPALLAGPLGRFFGKTNEGARRLRERAIPESTPAVTPHSTPASRENRVHTIMRRDVSHGE